LRSFLDAEGGSAHRYSLPIYALKKAKKRLMTQKTDHPLYLRFSYIGGYKTGAE